MDKITQKTSFEYSRKFVHMLSLGVPFAHLYFPKLTMCALIFFIIFYATCEFFKLKGRTGGINKIIGFMHRDNEKHTFAKAPLLLAIGVLFSITFFSWKASLVGIYMVGLSDTLAAWMGKKWGVTKIFFFNRKTLVGTLGFFLSAFPIALYFLPPSKAVVISLVGAFLESLPFRDWDNLTIPVIVTFLAQQFIF
ncbi:hypothetical protein K1X76_00030 [bacterium]|nr:hypothetical protein [bacterium]